MILSCPLEMTFMVLLTRVIYIRCIAEPKDFLFFMMLSNAETSLDWRSGSLAHSVVLNQSSLKSWNLKEKNINLHKPNLKYLYQLRGGLNSSRLTNSATNLMTLQVQLVLVVLQSSQLSIFFGPSLLRWANMVTRGYMPSKFSFSNNFILIFLIWPLWVIFLDFPGHNDSLEDYFCALTIISFSKNPLSLHTKKGNKYYIFDNFLYTFSNNSKFSCLKVKKFFK